MKTIRESLPSPPVTSLALVRWMASDDFGTGRKDPNRVELMEAEEFPRFEVEGGRGEPVLNRVDLPIVNAIWRRSLGSETKPLAAKKGNRDD